MGKAPVEISLLGKEGEQVLSNLLRTFFGEPVSSVSDEDTFYLRRIALNLFSYLCPLAVISSHEEQTPIERIGQDAADVGEQHVR